MTVYQNLLPYKKERKIKLIDFHKQPKNILQKDLKVVK